MSKSPTKSSEFKDEAKHEEVRQSVGSQLPMKSAKTVSSSLESAIKKDVIPNLYSQFGPGMISRKKRRTSLLSSAIRDILNEPYEAPQFDADWFSTREDFDDLVHCLRNDDDAGALSILDRVSERGANFTDIALGIITEVMVLFNYQWETDEISFVDVTLASNVVKRILRDFVYKHPPIMPPAHLSKMALITTLPGEDHNVGAQIIEHTLAGSGWVASSHSPSSTHDLSVKVRREWFTLVGISVTESRLLKQCARVVEDVRANSQNPDVIIMVGGRAISQNYDEAQLIGADVTALDAKHALSIAAKIDRVLLEIPEVGGSEVRLKTQWTSVSRD
ncbi:MAG: cobalamin-dependent protein [Hyphomicrobiales bacterium]